MEEETKFTRNQEPSNTIGEEGEDLVEEATRWQESLELVERLLMTKVASTEQEGLLRLRDLVEERREAIEELFRVVTRKFHLKPIPPGIVSRPYTAWNHEAASNIEKTRAQLLGQVVAPTTMTKHERGFEHWRIFLHNRRGPNFSPWIVQRGSKEAEDVFVEYLCWLFSIGNSYSTMRGKFAAIRC